MRILFAGTPDVAATCLSALADSSHEVVGVLTQPDARGKRGKSLVPSPVAVLAQELGIPSFKPADARSAETREWIRESGAEVAAVVAYGQILERPVLESLPGGFFNLHFSLLPALRGAAPVQRAIEQGLQETGLSVFKLDEGLDTGALARQEPHSIAPLATAGELLEDMAEHGARVLVEVMDELGRGTLTLTAQEEEGASYARKLRADEARINPARPAREVAAHIRAFAPNPGAFTSVRGSRLKVLGVGNTEAPESMSLAPGEFGVTKKHVFLGTATEPLELTLVGPAGKKHMAAADWARGVRLETGERMEEESAA
ncbi:methionyl-tRNA formyltransferase [Dermabacter hominis]|uniref:methionyl-tRNA formyltransferase n=1 Tax=Dermabacter hominis TaxID=36740 RepID=UPI0021A5DA56|nr:methionyl-tRNA formyltransferase [Dermabacter hominis]MCT1954729.1 methionyl-tRNA formyltransferase [Dermabacter hominis]